jgi:acylphosphatase
MLCRHYIVEGQVQGVFFRASTRDIACNIGVKGWVRNLSNGGVEVVACGTAQQLATLEVWLNNGPPMAVVSCLKKTDWESTADFVEFSIR